MEHKVDVFKNPTYNNVGNHFKFKIRFKISGVDEDGIPKLTEIDLPKKRPKRKKSEYNTMTYNKLKLTTLVYVNVNVDCWLTGLVKLSHISCTFYEGYSIESN